jgi:hypothetical protein
MAKPDVGVRYEAIFEAPLSPDHLLARKRLSLWCQLTDDGAGGTLVAFLEVVTA